MKRIKKLSGVLLACLLVLSLLGFVLPASADAAGPDSGANKIKVLIGFAEKPGLSEQALVRAFGGTIRYTYDLIPTIAAELPEQAVEALRRNPRVLLIEPDLTVYAIGSYEEELNRTWGLARIGEATAHSRSFFGSEIKVAVIDSGIDYDHPELAAVYAGGWDFVNSDKDPMDSDGHGTHVAGTIAAVRDGLGIVGAAPAVRLYALKALEGGSGNFSDIIAALDWCVVNGIQITNNSYGSTGDPGTQVMNAFDASYKEFGILHIASAGNNGNASGRGDNVGYPARYSSVVAVAASDENDRRASFSSTGTAVELMAPGVGIYSTWIGGTFRNASGTSMASPHAAGVAAQVWAAGENLDNALVRQILLETAENLGLPAVQQGYGLLRADLATASAAGQISVKTGVISGTVRDVNNQLIADAVISVAGTDLVATTTTLGTYTFDPIAVGTYSLNASAAGFVSQTNIEVVVNENQTSVVEFILVVEPDELTVHVQTDKRDYTGNTWVLISDAVSNSNGPVANATVIVTIQPPQGNPSLIQATTGSDGSATVRYRILKSSAKGIYDVIAETNQPGVIATDKTSFNVS